MTINAEIKSKRIWFVPRFQVWGQESLGGLHYLAYEQQPTASVIYGRTDIGGTTQIVPYDSLIDHRGNPLPTSINRPLVMIRPRQSEAVFLIGDETDLSFKIARDSSSSGAVTVDLMIVEMGD